MERDLVALATYLVLIDDGKVLLFRRANSGWYDGHFTLPAGHVDLGEPARSAMAREAREELGISVDPTALDLVHTMHRDDAQAYVDLYYAATSWTGEPRITEPHKATDLGWFDLEALPADTIPTVRQALVAIGQATPYSEHGW